MPSLLLLTFLWLTTPTLAQGFRCAGSQGIPTTEAILPPGIAAKPAQTTPSRTTGTRRTLVLFARFKGDPTSPVPSWAVDIFNPDLPGSFSHFYDTMSFDKLQVRGEVGPRVYESAQPASAYLENDQTPEEEFGRFSLEILRQADRDLDFAQFDNDGTDGVPNSGDDDGVVDAVFIVMGRVPTDFLLAEATGVGRLGFAEVFFSSDTGKKGKAIQIFPGQGTIQQGRSFAETIGVMCHEYGHVLGLPDLYNTEFIAKEEAGPEEDSAGVGAWCLMGWGATGWNGNDGPNSFCAWSRMKLGWAEVNEVKSAQQSVRLRPVGQRGRLLKVPVTGQEYFLAEYRRRKDQYYDRNIPGEGLLIWHVRRRPNQGEQYPYEIDLECADGRWQEAGFPQGKTADPQAGADNLDFWADDAKYTQEHTGNLGDSTDPFDGVRFAAFTPATNPASFDGAGVLSARIEGIALSAEEATAQVQTSPLLVEVRKLSLGDQGADGLVLAGEELKLSFQLANTGGLEAPEVRTVLRSDDPLVEILQSETQFGVLALGKVTVGGGSGFPVFRFQEGFFGTHTATLVLEVWVEGTLVEERQIEVAVVSPRQQVSRVVVIDTLGNGDGAAQAGELIRLHLDLDEVADPAMLRFFTFHIHPLDQGVISVGSTRFHLVGQADLSDQHTPEFLISSQLETGRQLPFELVANSGFSVWRDTFAIELAPGPDQTPPRVQGLRVQSVADGVLISLPREGVVEGGGVREAEARVFAAVDTSLLAVLPLHQQTDGYEGKWSTRQSGTYLAAGVVEDNAGNQGRSRLQEFSIFAGDAGQAVHNPWEALPLPGAGERPSIDDLVLAPGNPEVMYAPTSQGLWRSEDFGQTWVRTGLMQDARIMVDAVDPLAIYTDTGLKSRDGGLTWEAMESRVALITADPVRSGRLYGNHDGYLAISADAGQTWKATEVEAGDFVAVHPLDPQVVYSGRLKIPDQVQSRQVPGDLWRSADGGHTWDRQRLGAIFQTITIDPHNPEGLYGARRDTVFYSPDQGVTWEQRGVLDSQNPSVHLSVHPHDPNLIFAWPGIYGLWRSRDAGQTWEQLLLPEYQGVSQVILYPNDPHRILVVTDAYYPQSPAMHTRDDGESWEQIHLPQVGPGVGMVDFDPAGRGYAGGGRTTSDGNTLPVIFTSSDQGRSWEEHAEGVAETGARFAGMVLTELLYRDPQQPQIWIAGMVGGGIFLRSVDEGRNWKRVGPFGFAIRAYPVLVAAPGQAGGYYLVSPSGIWRSADFGETWDERVTGLPQESRYTDLYGGLVITPGSPPTLYAASNEDLFQSRNEGLHWELVGRLHEAIQALALNTLEPQRLYAATQEGLYVSIDQGRNWSLLLVNPGRDTPGRMRLRFDPHDPARMLWVTGPTLLETRDGGRTWENLGEGLASAPWFNDVAVDPAQPQMVYAATPWGVYRLDTSKQVTVVEEEEGTPSHFSLSPNYPNPFNPTTTLRFSLPQAGEAELSIYNLLGQRVATLVRGVQEAGPQALQWDGRDEQGRELASGVYFYHLQAGNQVETRKLLLLR